MPYMTNGKRDYKKQQKYDSKPENIAKRSEDNKARSIMDEGGSSAQGGWEGRGPHQAAEQGWEDDEEQSEGSVSAHQSFIRPDFQR
jgi:hypothetical protein